jgi:hypothetical protein
MPLCPEQKETPKTGLRIASWRKNRSFRTAFAAALSAV